MTRKEAAKILYNQWQGFLEDNIDYAGVSDAYKMAIKALEQEPCEDEYIKVPKKALKYRTAGMVAYNAEWLKNHFDIERVAICGAQQPCEDAISRQAVLEIIRFEDKWLLDAKSHNADTEIAFSGMLSKVSDLSSVKPKMEKEE